MIGSGVPDSSISSNPLVISVRSLSRSTHTCHAHACCSQSSRTHHATKDGRLQNGMVRRRSSVLISCRKQLGTVPRMTGRSSCFIHTPLSISSFLPGSPLSSLTSFTFPASPQPPAQCTQVRPRGACLRPSWWSRTW